MVRVLILLCLLGCWHTAPAASASDAPRLLAHTFSIVARDPETGQLGIAVQTHWYGVGQIVGWVEAGVGAVATQSFVDPSYGPLGLDLLRVGKHPREVLTALASMDSSRAVRQVGMVDAQGRAAAFTGDRAIAEVCHMVGEGYAIQANLMENPTVCDAMLRAYQSTEGDFPARLMAALVAAQGEGGDIRGRQSAFMKIVSGKAGGNFFEQNLFDLRVDDHPAPLDELARQLVVARTYRLFSASEAHLAAGRTTEASAAFDAARALSPDNHEILFWRAVSLTERGELDQALPLYARAFALWPKWRIVVDRLPAAGLLPDDPSLLHRIRAAR